MTTSRTYRAVVRFKDGTKQKYDVCDVPDDPAIARDIMQRELAATPPQVILIAIPGGGQTKREAA